MRQNIDAILWSNKVNEIMKSPEKRAEAKKYVEMEINRVKAKYGITDLKEFWNVPIAK